MESYSIEKSNLEREIVELNQRLEELHKEEITINTPPKVAAPYVPAKFPEKELDNPGLPGIAFVLGTIIILILACIVATIDIALYYVFFGIFAVCFFADIALILLHVSRVIDVKAIDLFTFINRKKQWRQQRDKERRFIANEQAKKIYRDEKRNEKVDDWRKQKEKRIIKISEIQNEIKIIDERIKMIEKRMIVLNAIMDDYVD